MKYQQGLFFAGLLLSFCFTHAQPKDNTCGCDYLPLCKYQETKVFGGKTYKGFQNENGNMEWYHCENGVVTKKWYESYYPEEVEKRYDPFRNRDEYHYYTGPKQEVLQTRVILKYNLPEGTKWTQEVTELNGYINTHYWVIQKKGISIQIDGISYSNVIKIKYSTKANDIFNTPGFFYYYAKGKGNILTERETAKDQSNALMEELLKIQARLVKDGSLKGTIENEITGLWKTPLTPTNDMERTLELNPDGTGVLSIQSDRNNGFSRILSNTMSGKASDDKIYFFWRTGNGIKILWLDETLKVAKTETYTLEKLIDQESKRAALNISGINYVSTTKTKWQTQNNKHAIGAKAFASLKGSIDPAAVGKWKNEMPLENGKKMAAFYIFKEDGTYEYNIPELVAKGINTMTSSGYWRIDGNSIEMLMTNSEQVQRYPFRITTDNKTGKRKIVISIFNIDTEFEYFAPK